MTQLRAQGAAALAGLQTGHLITHVGTKQIEDVSQLTDVRSPTVAFPLMLRVVRDGTPGFIVITGFVAR